MTDEDLSSWRNQTPEAVYNEAKRAREAEAEKSLENARLMHDRAELVRQLEAKDATITALANVLAALENRASTQYSSDPGCHEIIISNLERRAIRAALRLAGRIQ